MSKSLLSVSILIAVFTLLSILSEAHSNRSIDEGATSI
jgi:hypothetical protein